jgi:hypothetical protein
MLGLHSNDWSRPWLYENGLEKFYGQKRNENRVPTKILGLLSIQSPRHFT